MKAAEWINHGAERSEPERSGSKTAEWQIAEGKQTAEGCPQGKRSAVNPGGEVILGTWGRSEWVRGEEIFKPLIGR